MPARISFSIFARPFVSTVISFTALFLFTLGTLGQISAARANGSSELTANGGEHFTRVSTFDAEPDSSDPSLERRACASLAHVRWLPQSTVKINYTRGEFTKDELAEFHRAISLWQKALLEMKLGIVLEQGGEVEKDATPDPSQIIVKRDYSMDSGHYGKIVAATRTDNFLDRAFILINGNLRKRSSLRKTMLHELGHAFGLKDCPNCPSGATVMNYFSQQSVMGLNIGKAGRKISDKPSRCDISAVASGYRQSLPASAANPTQEWHSSRTLWADEAATVRGATRGTGDNNIIAQYLARSGQDTSGLQLATYFKTTAASQVYNFAPGPYSKPAVAHRIDGFASRANFQPVAVQNPFALKFGFYLRPTSTFADLKWTIPPAVPASSEKADVQPPASNLKVTSAPEVKGNVEPPLAAMRATEVKVTSASPRNSQVLTETEKVEFESHIPTLLGKEAETMDELNNYTFTRDVRIQTIDSKGRVSGEYRRTSDLVFDDSGQRIERGLSFSKSTLRRLKISPEYVEDFSGVQLKGFELSRRDHYRIEPFMTDTVGGIRTRVYRMTPLNLKAERAAQARVFYGYVWVEESTGRIMKIGGCALPDGKQRFPLFETQRALVDGKHVFPLHTLADDYLVFSSHRIHVRMLITYSNYKRFESRVRVVEVDD